MNGYQAEAQPGTPGQKVQGFTTAPLIVTKLAFNCEHKAANDKKLLKGKLFMLAATVCFHSRQ